MSVRRDSSDRQHPTAVAPVLHFPVPDSDAGLVAALRAGYLNAGRALCKRCSPELRRVAMRILGPDPMIDVIVLDTLRWAIGHLDELANPRFFRLWLLSRLVVLARRRLRTRRLIQRLRGRSYSSGRYRDCSPYLAQTCRILDCVRIDDRIVYCLAGIYLLPMTDVAFVLGRSMVDVHRRLMAARAQLDALELYRLTRLHARDTFGGADIAREQDELLGDGQLLCFDLPQRNDFWRKFSIRRLGRVSWVPVLVVLVGALGACAAALVEHFMPIRAQMDGTTLVPTAGTRLGRRIAAPPGDSKIVTLSDGSSITLTPASRMRLLSTDHQGSSWLLESGEIRLRIGGSMQREHRLIAGPFVLTSTSSRAEISWNASDGLLQVTVDNGEVALSGCQYGERRVEAGGSIQTVCALK